MAGALAFGWGAMRAVEGFKGRAVTAKFVFRQGVADSCVDLREEEAGGDTPLGTIVTVQSRVRPSARKGRKGRTEGEGVGENGRPGSLGVQRK